MVEAIGLGFKKGDFVMIKDIHFVKSKFPSNQMDQLCRISGLGTRNLEIELYYLGKPLGIGTYLKFDQVEKIENQDMVRLLYG